MGINLSLVPKKKAAKKKGNTIINLRVGGFLGNPQSGGALNSPSPITDTSVTNPGAAAIPKKKKKKKVAFPTQAVLIGGAVVIGLIVVYAIIRRSKSQTLGQRLAAYGNKAVAAGKNFVNSNKV